MPVPGVKARSRMDLTTATAEPIIVLHQ
jgi:hypothetical protein